MSGRINRWPVLVVSGCLLAAACTSGTGTPSAAAGIHKIQHIIVIQQENRSFDTYFGTFPGADGIPASACVPDPRASTCAKPYVDHSDVNGGGPHGQNNAAADIDGGKMDGFVGQALSGKK